MERRKQNRCGTEDLRGWWWCWGHNSLTLN
jgi:hypothetical protein